MKMTMTVTMRTAIAGKALVIKYRVAFERSRAGYRKNISLVLLNQLLRITCVSRSYRTSRQVYQQAGSILAITECSYLLVELMLESYETSMNGFLRWVHKSRTVVDGGLSELTGAHYSL